MKWIPKITLLFSLIACYETKAQEDTVLHLTKTMVTDVVDITVDNLDNVYVLSSTGQLKKLNAAGDSVAVYNGVKNFGKLYAIDVTNPLKILLLYKDFSTIVVLDRLLTVRNTIDLRRHNILGVSAIGLSYDSNIWLFDSYNNTLKKIDEGGNVLSETPDFRSVFSHPFLPQQIIDENKVVYLYDTTKGILLFDYYGTFKKKLPITNWQNIEITNNFITGIVNNTVGIYNTETFMQYQRQLPADLTPSDKYLFSNNKLYAVSKNAVKIYQYGH